MGNGGFSYDSAGLTQVANELRAAGEHLSTVASKQVTAPDAGASSEVVGKAIADLIGLALGASALSDSMAGNVNAANGSYGNYENNAKGEVERRVSEGMKDYGNISEMNVPLN